MRIVFCGTPESAVPSLRALAAEAGWTVEAVLTQPDRPAGRGRKPLPSPVRRAAEEIGIPVLTPEKPKAVRAELEAMAPDVLAVVAYGHIFRRWLLELPRLGCVNVHFSLLPRHRGVAPVAWAILDGDAETGVATMRMDRGVDTGAVYRVDRVAIAPEDTTGSLTAKLAGRGAPLLVETLRGLEAGTLAAVPQPESGVTYARRLEKADGWIDWERPAEEIARRVRGLAPWPGAFTGWRGRTLKVHRAAAHPAAARSAAATPAGATPLELTPGRVAARDGRAWAGTSDGILELIEVQPEGKGRMEGEAWLRGARPREDEGFERRT